MRATIWGCRGSLATPGAATVRYGGNTTSLELETPTGVPVVIDAGTGIRPLGLALEECSPERIHLLLTHLHLDHVEGLGFFAPLFRDGCSVTVWGPPQDGSSLAARVAAYLSPPHFPLPFDRFGASIEFVEVWQETWELEGLRVTCAPVRHPGNTLGYRIEEGGTSLAFIPDCETALEPDSGLALAAGADALLHDAQYTADEYRTRVGWGHSALPDFAGFVGRADPERVLMFHHDPSHGDDVLEEMRRTAERLAGRPIELAAEGLAIDLASSRDSI